MLFSSVALTALLASLASLQASEYNETLASCSYSATCSVSGITGYVFGSTSHAQTPSPSLPPLPAVFAFPPLLAVALVQ